MTKYFTHYWQNSTWDWENERAPDERLNHVAGNEFRKRGVEPGDIIYVVTNKEGILYVAGRMRVKQFVSKRAAKQLLGYDVWDAREQVIGVEGTPIRYNCAVSPETTARLRFGEDESPLVMVDGLLDRQTLRGVRQLTPDSARLLDAFVEQNGVRRLTLANDVDEIVSNIRHFHAHVTSAEDIVRQLIAQTQYWVFDENSDLFGPSKFVAYSDISFSLYELAKRGLTYGDRFDGNVAQVGIGRLLGGVFQASPTLAKRCEVQWERILGPGSVDGVAQSKWKFIRIAESATLRRTVVEVEDPYEIPEPLRYVEGAQRRIVVNAYERDHRAREACIAHHGTACKVCEMNMEQRYGEIGRGFVHVHHLRQLSLIGVEYEVDPVVDLVPVCPNCHAMLHRQEPALTIEQLRDRMRPAEQVSNKG